MKRILLLFVNGVGLAYLLVAVAPAAAQGRGFSNRDLQGTYFFTVTEVRMVPTGLLNFCDHAGTLSFDGAGAVTVSDTRRCSVTGSTTETRVLDYTVNADGSFLVQDPTEAPDPVHGQIVDRGRSLLLDGTTRTDANKFVFHGVAMKP